ncbi:MAG TPA: radical SAM protein [Chloroflexi bacterium]|nr:radical SAM protein [Chloroflexota bacterium]
MVNARGGRGMADHNSFFDREWPLLQQADLYALRPNPTFGNPPFEAADFRVLIVRLSPFRDVDRSLPHLFLFDAVRRALPEAYIDLAFFPPCRDRERMEKAGVPLLVGVQSLRSVEDFDLVLVSNAYSLELLNLPYLLLRSGIPLLASQRDERWPILLLGGSNASAAHPVVGEDGDGLVDGIFFGEGEEWVGPLVRALWETKGRPKRERLARAAARVKGLWVVGPHPLSPCPPPPLPAGEGEGGAGRSPAGGGGEVEKALLPTPRAEHLSVTSPLLPGLEVGTAPVPSGEGQGGAGRSPAGDGGEVEKALLPTPRAEHLPVDYPLLPGPEAGTARLQITYGCPAFCTFCFEGYDRRPYREVPLEDVVTVARRLKQAHGCHTLELYSFNFNTHSDILTMLFDLSRIFDRVGLKSQRVDILYRTPGLLEAEMAAEKRSFTLGIEGISERLRAWLHKSLPAEMIEGVLDRLLRERARQIKLFYLLTGYETETDLAEFRGFVRWLKDLRRRHHPTTRVVFSFGLLVRMPFTPLQFDRLFLDPEEWKPILGPTKSICETNGFEFRLAAPWEEYATSQVLAMGGHWLLEPLLMLAEQGHCYDERLTPGCWESLHRWLVEHGRWTPDFLGEKDPSYPFAFPFLRSNVSTEFLYRQYRRAREGVDEGYCLGNEEGPGRCLGCGACTDAQRRAITGHRLRQPGQERSPARLRELVRAKRRLRPVYVRLRLPSAVAGAVPEWVNAWVMRGVLQACPEQVDNLLSARESLFTVGDNRKRYPHGLYGETVFAFRAWDAEALLEALATAGDRLQEFFDYLSPVEGFEPGRFSRATLGLILPADRFPDAAHRLRDFLRDSYVPCNLRREGERLYFDLPPKALRKRVLFAGWGRQEEGQCHLHLEIGPKFDLLSFLRSFEQPGADRLARMEVLEFTE